MLNLNVALRLVTRCLGLIMIQIQVTLSYTLCCPLGNVGSRINPPKLNFLGANIRRNLGFF